MKHANGITSFLSKLYGAVVKEYDNGDGNKPHPDFKGAIGIRQIALSKGTGIEVTVVLDDNFKLYTADGVWVEIYSGSQIGSLGPDDRGQRWWISGNAGMMSGTYRFTYYTIFDEYYEIFEKQKWLTKHVAFSAPDADDGAYENASHCWVVDGSKSLNPSSIVVYVNRGKWVGASTSLRTKMEPIQMLKEPLTPKEAVVVNTDWTIPLKGKNGHPYIFEFRNMGLDGIETDRQEAEEEFGNELAYSSGTDDNAFTDKSSENGVGDDDGDGSELDGIAGLDASESGSDGVFNTDDEDTSDWEFEMDWEEPYARENRKRKHAASQDRQRPLNSYVERRDQQNEQARIVKLPVSYTGPGTLCSQGEQDDPEELPETIITPAKIETATPPPLPGFQQLTPAPSRVESGIASPSNSASTIGRPGSNKSLRHYKRSTVSQSNPGLANSPTNSNIIMPPFKRSRKAKKQVESIDLTEGDDNDVRIKQEATDAIPTTGNSQTVTTTAEEDDEEEEDLKNEKRLIQIDMRLKELKNKKKTAKTAGQAAMRARES